MEKRHEIYKLALKQLIKDAKNPYCYLGLCHSLAKPLRVSMDAIDFKKYPELLAKKPKNMHSNCRWFHPSDADSRIDILKECIKETEPKCAPKTN